MNSIQRRPDDLPMIAMLDRHEEFRSRRERLLSAIGTGVAVFRSAPAARMHADVHYPYRQDSDFYYVTGFNEPEAVAILAPQHPEHQFVLFVQPKDRHAEMWSGRRLGVEAAIEALAADAVYPIDELDQHLAAYLKTGDRIFYRLGNDPAFEQRLLAVWQTLLRQYAKRGEGPIALEDPIARLHPLRNQKSAYELDQLRQAAAIAVEAHQLAIDLARPGRWEYEIQAEIDRLFRLRGGWGPGYSSIVATGDNACILHYIDNQSQLRDGDLLLIDAGCAWNYYNSDITRTFPVNGRFSREQQILYELVLEAQTQAIAEAKPGNTFQAVHDRAVQVLVDGLLDLGLLVGDRDVLIKHEVYKAFYPHRTSHWLGLDVHDVGLYQQGDQSCLLQHGHVLTIEPGLYISHDFEQCQPPQTRRNSADEGGDSSDLIDRDPDSDSDHNSDSDEETWPEQPIVPECWRGIGIRIEDDLFITSDGHEILTAGAPKTVAELTRA